MITRTNNNGTVRGSLLADVKAQLSGREIDVLRALAPETVEALDAKRHVHCPLLDHPDEHPSFRWDSNNQRFQCSCGSYDLFAYLQKANQWDFAGTLSRVADHLGVTNGKSEANSKPKQTYAEPNEAALAYGMGTPDAEWWYTDLDGRRVGKTLRWNKGGRKEIRPIARIGNRWQLVGMPTPRPLYRLSEIDGLHVYIGEGERVADVLEEVGFVGTTSSGGCNSVHQTDWTPCRSRNCYIFPDNDDPGRDYAEALANILHGLGCHVFVIELPDLPEGGGDLVDYVKRLRAEGKTENEISDDIEGRTTDVLEWKPGPSFDTANGVTNGAAKDGDNLKPFRLDSITAADLASKDWTQTYLIKDMLTEYEICMMAGAKKSLKTNTLCDLAISLATATPFLGRFEVPASKMVGFISGESGGKTLAETMTRICASKTIAGDQLELRYLDQFILSMKMPQIDAPAHMKELARWLREHGVEVLLLDPAYLCMDGADSGNLMTQGAKLRRVSEVCSDAGVTLVLAHHTKKNTGRDSYDVPELEDIAWAGFQEFARQWWLMGRRERYVGGTGSHRLWFNFGGSAGHSGLWGLDIEEGIPSDDGGRRWEVDILTADEARSAASNDKERAKASKLEERFIVCRRRVLEALKVHPETAKQLRTITSTNVRECSESLECLRKDGLIETCEITKSNNQDYPGFRVIKRTPGTPGTPGIHRELSPRPSDEGTGGIGTL